MRPSLCGAKVYVMDEDTKLAVILEVPGKLIICRQQACFSGLK
jgi:hypothetical protein